MIQTLLNATWRVETMVGRTDDLDKIKRAIYADPEDKHCRVVLVKGPGGIGKSRLLEEVQWRAGHPRVRREAAQLRVTQQHERDDWTTLGDVVISDTIDLVDIRLSARTQMLQALRDALSWQDDVDFSDHEAAMRGFLRAVEGSADFKTIKTHAQEAELAFWRAVDAQSQERRFVLIFDTAERLVLRSSRWLLARGLLNPEELRELSSQQWLLWQLEQGHFQNTTLVIAGRDGEEEGGPFFEQVRRVVANPKTPCTLVEIDLAPLSNDETATYFRYAASEWAERAISNRSQSDMVTNEIFHVSRTMNELVRDLDSLKVLHTATGGRPVLLSLYGDLIHEPDSMPELLQLTSDEVSAEKDIRGEDALQADIESSFISLLFQKPGLRSEIMQALARCPAGLDAEQLHFILDNKDDMSPADWKPNLVRIEEITHQTEQIRRLSIAKERPDGRLGLQDEIHRIYAQRMSDNEELRTYEVNARLRQYKRLSQWAEHKIEEFKRKRMKYQAEDERRLAAAIHSPVVALRPYWQSPTVAEQEERSHLQQAIRDWELERLHYDLLQNPSRGLNDSYTDLTERRWLSNIEEEEFIAQQEMWRVLHDRYALRFTEMPYNELVVLKRAARDEDPARWIKRFVLRRDYDRAIRFWQDVEASILDEDEDSQRTWQHPLNAGERMIWKSYAQIMRGDSNITLVVDRLKLELKLLRSLAAAPRDKPVGPRGETGFQGHDALPRLHRIIAVGYNFAGYGRVVAGQYGRGVGNYVRALLFMRETESKAQQAGTRNNLGRALASLGRDERGYRVCTDALTLRRELSAEIPIAYSLNTLALIGNGMQRTPTAWREAAQAAAIFRRAGDNRGLGLALIQLGIGLRRLANSSEPTVVLEATRDELYAIAQRAIGEAVDIFDRDPEVLRRIEARLELACVLRDQMSLDTVRSSPGRLARFHRDCEIEFGRAIELAQSRGFEHLALQAQVDLAWANYFAGLLDVAEEIADEVRDRVAPGYLIESDYTIPIESKESHIYYQLAKVYGLYATIAMERFKTRREELRKELSNNGRSSFYSELEKDAEANRQMAASAKSFVLSLAYGQLYSPRSRSLVITFDQIYDYLKEFNVIEYRMFRKAAQKPQLDLKKAQGDVSPTRPGNLAYDFSNLDQWLEDCFGPLELSDE